MFPLVDPDPNSILVKIANYADDNHANMHNMIYLFQLKSIKMSKPAYNFLSTGQESRVVSKI